MHYSNPPARNTDPGTSHVAARLLSSGKSQCLAILRAHAALDRTNPGDGLTDFEAAQAADLANPGVCWWHRCSDLRKLGLIAWKYVDGTFDATDGTSQVETRPGVSGRPSGVSTITAAGRAELDRHDS